MSSWIHHALQAGARTEAPVPPKARRTLLLGAAGPLGSALLERLLAHRQQGQVVVATLETLNVGLRGLEELRVTPAGDLPPVRADAAVLVFDRPRFSNGRDDAFWCPAPRELLAVARWLRANGVPSLTIVMPHAPSSLPDALKQGLANLDEHAVAMLGFEWLLFVRSAQRPQGERPGLRLERLAQWMLSQLQLMVPKREQPVRPAKVAEFVQICLARLREARAGTWVARPELVWEASQTDDIEALVQHWLGLPAGAPQALPEPAEP